jgi:hypothetical protein
MRRALGTCGNGQREVYQAPRARIQRACAARLLTKMLESFPNLGTLAGHVQRGAW